MSELNISGGNPNSLDILADSQAVDLTGGTCSFCDQDFKRATPTTWSRECKPCMTCPECGSGFTIRYYPLMDEATGPRLARCMACLHGWNSPVDKENDDE